MPEGLFAAVAYYFRTTLRLHHATTVYRVLSARSQIVGGALRPVYPGARTGD